MRSITTFLRTGGFQARTSRRCAVAGKAANMTRRPTPAASANRDYQALPCPTSARGARAPMPCRLAPGKKTGIAGHFPHLAEHPLGGLENRKIDIGADVEDADFQRRVLVGVIEEGRDLVLLPRIQRAREDRSSGALDFLHQRLELGAVAPPGEYGESFRGKFLRDLAADVVAGAYHRGRCVAFFHFNSPKSVPRPRAAAPCRKTFPCRRKRSGSRTRRAGPHFACSRSASP